MKRSASPTASLEVCRRILQTMPDQLAARLGEASSLQTLGRYEEAENTLKILFANAERIGNFRGTVFQFLVSDQLSKPEDQRDWHEVDTLADTDMSGQIADGIG